MISISMILVISIPYGSIKSGVIDNLSDAFEGFQFLMVRLKVDAAQRF